MNAQAKQDLIRRKRRLSTSTSCLDDDSSEVTRELTIDEIRLPSPEKEFAPEIVSQYTVADMKRLGRRTGRRDPWRC
ncbi:hypothetical protein NEOLI_004550 [Neolecta irregularis DAH-3]|uniref:Uncharacterized protein n=1 Tax=Neolecta irregularis (strain DAH-3) TaxID=1198029 RepID=A0A1U7LSC2_NEOID|nr:hypothetical protein NEOLI_004550 [Neolecta irregularis DAH-3]|eukprot:OLL25518.1 hypothetical protein NEOLI_004550 [Neolecta irregularis DAH-3]